MSKRTGVFHRKHDFRIKSCEWVATSKIPCAQHHHPHHGWCLLPIHTLPLIDHLTQPISLRIKTEHFWELESRPKNIVHPNEQYRSSYLIQCILANIIHHDIIWLFNILVINFTTCMPTRDSISFYCIDVIHDFKHEKEPVMNNSIFEFKLLGLACKSSS